MKFLLDTCVISELIKAKPELRVVSWVRNQNEEDLYLSVLTIGEIKKGIEKLSDSNKRIELTHWVDQKIITRFADRLLPVDEHVSSIWGEVQALAEKRGRRMPVVDSLIAATGIANSLTVVTRNVNDMIESGVRLFNLWEL